MEEIERLRNQITSLERDNSELKYRASQVETLSAENDRITRLHRELQSELEHWRYKYAEYSGLQS